MKAASASNDNRSIMSVLPAPVSQELFNLGWRHANDLFVAVKLARPVASVGEIVIWIGGARQQMNIAATQCLQGFCEFQLDEIFRWIAERVAREGFDAFFNELLPLN